MTKVGLFVSIVFEECFTRMSVGVRGLARSEGSERGVEFATIYCLLVEAVPKIYELFPSCRIRVVFQLSLELPKNTNDE